MELTVLDFETYFDDEYSLKKMTIEEYVRDERFKVHCVGFMLDRHYGSKAWVDNDFKYGEGLNKLAFLCHHSHFDGLILSHLYNIRPAFWFDTLSMARLVLPHLKSHSLEALATHYGLGTKTVPYNLFKNRRNLDPDTQRQLEEGCKHDVELTYKIFKKLLPCVSQEELKVIDLTIRMFTEPVLQLNRERISEYLRKTISDKETLLQQCGVVESDLASAPKFAECLKAVGVEPPTKISVKTGKETYAMAKTDLAFKELCESENETIAVLCAARLGVKSTLAETRAGRLLSASNRGSLPVYLKYYGAHTGRWSGGDNVNWQNFPRGGEIRKSILAPEGQVLVVLDLSQIECRMLNYLAGQEDVLQAFREGRDLYCEAASRFYGRVITKNDKQERQLFKQVELGCGYGMGANKFKSYVKQSGITVSDEEADKLIKFYRQIHPQVTAYWKRADRLLGHMATHETASTWWLMRVEGNKITYPNGGFSIYHNLHKDESNEWYYTSRGRDIKIYGSLLVENIVQALSRVILSQAMLKISKTYKVVMSTHDEVVFLAPEHDAEEAYQQGLKIMTEVPAWCKGLPLAAEGGYARNYSK